MGNIRRNSLPKIHGTKFELKEEEQTGTKGFGSNTIHQNLPLQLGLPFIIGLRQGIEWSNGTGVSLRSVFCVDTLWRPRLICSSSLTQRLLGQAYTSDWVTIIQLISNPLGQRVEAFLFRYAFQASLYHFWREKNDRRHGNSPSAPARLIKTIDKTIRNRVSSIRAVDKQYEDGLVVWFGTRP